MSNTPRIALTMGDPAGIGPEIILRMIDRRPDFFACSRLVIYGCPDIIREAAVRFAPRFADIPLSSKNESAQLTICPTGNMRFSDVTPSRLDAACGREAYNAVVTAAKDVFSGKADAIVTAPVNKAAVNLAGIPFTGHTELVAEICGTQNFAMMQSSGGLRVVFVTTHIPLKDVVLHATFERIVDTALLLADAIRAEGIASPKIAVAAINPHAGENGHMGQEDELVVKPAIAKMCELGLDVEGPFPPDTLFIKSTLDRFDGIVSMYHDQGHIPFKMLAFDRGVNSTLGLPVIRTSVDHGTAFEIAWKGVADTGSLEAAYILAVKRAAAKIAKAKS